jgi:hypothetical protein
MVHFHIGSQIPDIRNIKAAMTEVSRYYVELRQMGVGIEYVDVGGGLGVDYEGTRSTAAAPSTTPSRSTPTTSSTRWPRRAARRSCRCRTSSRSPAAH